MRLAALIVIVAASGVLAARAQDSVPASDPSAAKKLEERVADLERRIQLLEKALAASAMPVQGKAKAPIEPPKKDGEFRVAVTLKNKRFNDERLNKAIYWDAEYDFSTLPNDTRAMKGVLEFCDLFGEPKLIVRNTLNDPIQKASKYSESGQGIEYNQFMDTHKWLRATEINDMKVFFRVQQIIYADGTTAEFK